MGYLQEFKDSIDDPETFWIKKANLVHWFKKPAQALTLDEDGFHRWYRGGKLNTAYLALDYHVENGRAHQTALVYDSPVTQTVRSYTFQELLNEVAVFSGVLKRLGVTKGDTVLIYMPMVPEAVIGMLACARIGAIHSVVFGGFGSHELAIRIDDTKPKVILSASFGIEVERVIPYKPLLDRSLAIASHQPGTRIILQRPGTPAEMGPHDLDWVASICDGKPQGYVEVDATDPLYILYTSGTTGKPKGIVRDSGGHAVAMKYSLEKIYDVQPGDVFWAASDIGWAVGHSYTVYAPLIHGCTTILFEGKPVKTPDAGTFWRIIEQHKVSVLFTAPTSIRAIKKEDPEGTYLKAHDTGSLKYLFVAGERCDVATYEWAKRKLGVEVIDHWWQTESGWPMIANMMGLEGVPVKPGSVARPIPGFDVRVVDENGAPQAPHVEGTVLIRLPLPPGCLPYLWNDKERFRNSYLTAYPGFYLTGDGGYEDEDGYIYIMGRMDDIINVAGHRLSTGSIEEVIATHPQVAECAVVGIADELKGQVPVGLVVLKDNASVNEAKIEEELVASVREEIGAVACFRKVVVVKRLPKTRSGKILRKTISKMADAENFSMPATIDDPLALEEVRAALAKRGIGSAILQEARRSGAEP